MADLIAQGPQNYHRWRREIPEPTTCADLVIGRDGADWNVPWDRMISRAHVRLIPQPDQRVEIVAIPSARNPVYHQGRHAVRFVLVPGDHFVIGRTTFTLAAATGPQRGGDALGPQGIDVTESVFDHVALRRRHFRDVNARIDVLTRLPDLIASTESDQELLVRVTSVLLQSTPAAEAVSILSAAELENDSEAPIQVLHYDNRNATLGGCPVSRQLVIRSIEKRESILNVWSKANPTITTSAFTATEDVDWAFSVPLRSDACRGWVIYVTGQIHDPDLLTPGGNHDISEELQDDVKFAEIVGTTVAGLRQSRQLQRRQAAMRHFFSPIVMRALSSGDSSKVLQPREADLTVMFCDLRGFSSRSEQDSENLLQLLSDVSDALGVMTKHILGFEGVIGDFHGDAAMGFWGWPLAQEQSEFKAAAAALAIRTEYHRSNLGFRCGIGIAHGRAVAGQIGTTDQVKVTAFGPVVNLSARLESMTKRFGAEIIVDPATREALRHAGEDDCGESFRIRRLATVRPAGFSAPIEVSQVIPGVQDPRHEVTDELIQEYEAAMDLFCNEQLDEALRRLRSLPPWDGPTQFLIQQILAAEHPGGVIDLPK